MRNQYDKEFKVNVCKDILKGETSVTAISKEYSISRPIVSRWVSEYRRYQNKAFSGHGKEVRFQFIYKNKHRYSISQSAKLLHVTRQGYYSLAKCSNFQEKTQTSIS